MQQHNSLSRVGCLIKLKKTPGEKYGTKKSCQSIAVSHCDGSGSFKRDAVLEVISHNCQVFKSYPFFLITLSPSYHMQILSFTSSQNDYSLHLLLHECKKKRMRMRSMTKHQKRKHHPEHVNQNSQHTKTKHPKKIGVFLDGTCLGAKGPGRVALQPAK